jgi:hypothetical protein
LPGRLEISFALPAAGLAQSAPLLSAGRTGAADSLYIRPAGAGKYVLGLDHWGFPARESAPLPLAGMQVHRVAIEWSSLFPPERSPGNRARVWLDGVVILDERLTLHPVTPGEIEIGRNPLGFSTSTAQFPGEIYSVRRHAEAIP